MALRKIVIKKGMRFDKLTVIEEIPKEKYQEARQVLCQCDCGNTCVKDLRTLRRKNKGRSCGCLKQKQNLINIKKASDSRRIYPKGCKAYDVNKIYRKTMAPPYVKYLLVKDSKILKHENIPNELVLLKQKHLELNRLLKGDVNE